ncbi:MAG: hypothetical protein H0W28_11010 [Pyrinomonadaceae bacterium]|jgi:hypothetical protein|nr:hypothetical protein [Pyrinomonadaceae bacterium]
MAKRPLLEMRVAIREEAIKTLRKWGSDADVMHGSGEGVMDDGRRFRIRW